MVPVSCIVIEKEANISICRELRLMLTGFELSKGTIMRLLGLSVECLYPTLT